MAASKRNLTPATLVLVSFNATIKPGRFTGPLETFKNPDNF